MLLEPRQCISSSALVTKQDQRRDESPTVPIAHSELLSERTRGSLVARSGTGKLESGYDGVLPVALGRGGCRVVLMVFSRTLTESGDVGCFREAWVGT